MAGLALAFLGWLWEGSRRAQEALKARERADLLQTVVKLANKDSNNSELLVEGLKEVTKSYTDSLTRLVVGYQPTESRNNSNSVLDLNAGDNTFPIPTEYVPEHELQDRYMLDEEDLNTLKPVPTDGKGGWLE